MVLTRGAVREWLVVAGQCLVGGVKLVAFEGGEWNTWMQRLA
jgi:hypothetical protein